jgi:hypothetical protein
MTKQLLSNITAALEANDTHELKHLMKSMTEAEGMAAAKTLNNLASKVFGWN